MNAVPTPMMNVHNALVACDVDTRDNFEGQTVAERIS